MLSLRSGIRRGIYYSVRWNSTHVQRTCPSCSATLLSSLPACTNCSYIERVPRDISFFKVLGLEEDDRSFELDERDLKRRFLQAQRVCHPDAWSSKGEKAHAIAEEQSSLLNSAYRTLLSPVLRAQYILTMNGHPPSETDKLSDQAFILEVMDARERIEDAATREEVDTILDENRDRISKCAEDLASLLRKRKWVEAGHAAVKLKYLEGIENAAKEWKEPQ